MITDSLESEKDPDHETALADPRYLEDDYCEMTDEDEMKQFSMKSGCYSMVTPHGRITAGYGSSQLYRNEYL